MRMYKLLLVTDQKEILAMFQKIDWARLNCRVPLAVATAEEAIAALNSRAIDAVGYALSAVSAAPLAQYLRYGRPSLPVFEIADQLEKQQVILHELLGVLDRLHADYSDEPYDEDAMLTLQRDELTHSLLAGEYDNFQTLERELKLIRARINPRGKCVLYEIDMPQGEVYLAEHHGHPQERLESALRNNFFGRYVDGIYYAVAVLTPRHIRLVCIPMQAESEEDAASFAARADEHVAASIQMIKEYLDLDMSVLSTGWLNGLNELIIPATH